MLQLQSRWRASPDHRVQVTDQEKTEGPQKAHKPLRKEKIGERRITKRLEDHCVVHEYQSGSAILYVVL